MSIPTLLQMLGLKLKLHESLPMLAPKLFMCAEARAASRCKGPNSFSQRSKCCHQGQGCCSRGCRAQRCSLCTRYFCRVDGVWNASTKSQVYVTAADDDDHNNNDDAVLLLSVLLLLFFTSLMLLKVLQWSSPAPTTNVSESIESHLGMFLQKMGEAPSASASSFAKVNHDWNPRGEILDAL